MGDGMDMRLVCFAWGVRVGIHRKGMREWIEV